MRQLTNPHERVLTRQEAGAFATVLRALGHPVRMQALSLLLQAPSGMRVMELTDAIGFDQSWVSSNLRPLVAEGFVERERKGTPYRIVPGALDFVASFLRGDQ